MSARSLWRSHRAKQWVQTIGLIFNVRVEERSIKARNRKLYQIVVRSSHQKTNRQQHLLFTKNW